MQPLRRSTYFSSVSDALSSQRLLPYRVAPTETDVQVSSRYLWNVALGEALYPLLESLEIVLRNSVHTAASGAFGTPMWFDEHLPSGRPLLLPNEQRRVAEAKAELARRGKPVTPGAASAGQLVAELNFGFWVSLFNAPYESPREPILWPRLIRSVFPHAPRRERGRKTLRARLDKIRGLRNRVFHYEPIWHRTDLFGEHDQILETIGWISPAARELARIIDRFPEVHRKGTLPYHAELASFWRNLPP
jgi:hypothetical protein